MASFLVRRLFHALTILLGVSMLVFLFVELAPGDAVDALMPPETMATPEAKAAMRERLGLNDPAPIRYVRWLERAVQGNFGYSLASRKPVTDIIMARLPKTLLLVGTAMVFSIVVGIATGVISAIKQYSIIDYVTTFFAFFWLSIPGFFLSLLVIYIFAVRLGWFPVFGASSPGAAHPVLDRLHHLVLPATVLGLELAAALTRYTRASLVEVLRADYMRTARAKGLKEWTVIIGHGLKNALIPIITVIAFRLPYLLSGAIIIETVFQWPGLGLLTLDAANHKDYPLILAITMAVTVLVVISSFIADVAYSLVDPRIRLG
ncbi:MAG: ABC transporter permease [Thermomicrobiales bacterium]|nr:ABC transporter permease [Thermomicrobiales bacterium]